MKRLTILLYNAYNGKGQEIHISMCCDSVNNKRMVINLYLDLSNHKSLMVDHILVQNNIYV